MALNPIRGAELFFCFFEPNSSDYSHAQCEHGLSANTRSSIIFASTCTPGIQHMHSVAAYIFTYAVVIWVCLLTSRLLTQH